MSPSHLALVGEWRLARRHSGGGLPFGPHWRRGGTTLEPTFRLHAEGWRTPEKSSDDPQISQSRYSLAISHRSSDVSHLDFVEMRVLRILAKTKGDFGIPNMSNSRANYHKNL